MKRVHPALVIGLHRALPGHRHPTDEARALRWERVTLGDPNADPLVPASAAVKRSVGAHG